VILLHYFEDNNEQEVNIPIWKTNKGMRLTQNYITEENLKNIPDIKIEEVGRLRFRGRFKRDTRDMGCMPFRRCSYLGSHQRNTSSSSRTT
jgi:hypothetical protein